MAGMLAASTKNNNRTKTRTRVNLILGFIVNPQIRVIASRRSLAAWQSRARFLISLLMLPKGTQTVIISK
jgi:hypothetical protein